MFRLSTLINKFTFSQFTSVFNRPAIYRILFMKWHLLKREVRPMNYFPSWSICFLLTQELWAVNLNKCKDMRELQTLCDLSSGKQITGRVYLKLSGYIWRMSTSSVSGSVSCLVSSVSCKLAQKTSSSSDCAYTDISKPSFLSETVQKQTIIPRGQWPVLFI